MPAFKVIIIGGGLAGALLANGLINNDVDVTVYERDQEESRREGYQNRLGEASLSGFRACLKPSQIREIEQKFGISSDGKEIQSTYTAPCVYSTKLRPVLDLGKLPNYPLVGQELAQQILAAILAL
jgi:flavin-dependent dehydrogenase